jgi:ABC-type transporter MlaC component
MWRPPFRVLCWLGALLAWAPSAVSAETKLRASKPEVRKDVVTVIEAQLAAFRKGDLPKAYGFAAAALRAQKPLPAFTTIVQTNYPEIWKSTRAEFGIVRDDGTRAEVTVQVFSERGDAAYDFTLQKEQGGWRIYGVLRHEPKKAKV